jgi:hypothetical protein
VTTFLRCAPEVADLLAPRFTDIEIAQIKRERAETDARYKERTGTDWPFPEEPIPERHVDFGVVIPEPEDLFRGGCDGKHPHPKEGGGFYEHCWYNWNTANWGTKWGAYDTEVTIEPDVAVVQFDTAWSHPFPVMKVLSQRFPDETLDVMYADEDLGFNCGAYSIKNGEVIEERVPEGGSAEALELASQIKYGKSYAEAWTTSARSSSRSPTSRPVSAATTASPSASCRPPSR